MLKIILLKILLHFFAQCSAKVLQYVSAFLALILNYIPSRRRLIIDVNLAHCFPHLNLKERQSIRQKNIQHIIRSILERGRLWLGTRQQIEELVKLNGREHLDQALASHRPIILMGMHNVGLEAAVYRIGSDAIWNFGKRFANIYMPDKNLETEKWLRKTRCRFDCQMFSKKDSAKQLIKHLNQKFDEGAALLNMNADMDFGEKGAYYIPFFGQEAATVANILKMSHACNAIIIPFYAIYDAQKLCYQAYIQPPLFDTNFNSNLNLNIKKDEASLIQDLHIINENIEAIIAQDITQYWWVHRRFKTQRDRRNIYKTLNKSAK